MGTLREMSYHEVVKRLQRLGFRFYRKGKGSHELWVRDADGRAVPVPRYRGSERHGESPHSGDWGFGR